MSTILIVEDEQVLRDLMESELKKHGYLTVTAENGAEGLERTRESKPDLILLDLLMPVMTGYDFLEVLHADENLKAIPCIVLSNSGQTDDLNRAYKCGANDVLIKAEFNPDQLVTKVTDQLLSVPHA